MTGPSPPPLRRTIGPLHATAMVVGTIIGASIFVQPSEITRQMPSLGGVLFAFMAQKLEVLGGLKPKLVEEQARTPGSRVLDGQITGVQQAIGAPKGRAAAAKYLREFAEDVKRSGFVARTIEKHDVRGVTVAK